MDSNAKSSVSRLYGLALIAEDHPPWNTEGTRVYPGDTVRSRHPWMCRDEREGCYDTFTTSRVPITHTMSLPHRISTIGLGQAYPKAPWRPRATEYEAEIMRTCYWRPKDVMCELPPHRHPRMRLLQRGPFLRVMANRIRKGWQQAFDKNTERMLRDDKLDAISKIRMAGRPRVPLDVRARLVIEALKQLVAG